MMRASVTIGFLLTVFIINALPSFGAGDEPGTRNHEQTFVDPAGTVYHCRQFPGGETQYFRGQSRVTDPKQIKAIQAQQQRLGRANAPTTPTRYIVQFKPEPLGRRKGLRGADKLRALDELKALHARFAGELEQKRRGSGKAAAAGKGTKFRRQYFQVLNGVAIEMSAEEAAWTRRLPYVKKVERDTTTQAQEVNSNITRIKATDVWTSCSARGSGRVVAIIDTGVDYTHPDLGGGIGASFQVIGGYDYVNDDTNPVDDNGHGTHVAGIAAANGTTLSGVAPQAKLLAYKVLNHQGSGQNSDVLWGVV